MAKQLDEVLDQDDLVPLFLDLLFGPHPHDKTLPVGVQIKATSKDRKARRMECGPCLRPQTRLGGFERRSLGGVGDTALLAKREGSIASGTFVGTQPEKTSLDELLEEVLNDYRVNNKKNIQNVTKAVCRLKTFFGAARAQNVTTAHIREYIAFRQSETIPSKKRPPANSSINRELSTLQRAFSLGLQAAKVVTVPYVPKLRENNVRKGFFHHNDYLRLKDVLPWYLCPVVTLAYHSGMRIGEVLSLKWDQVDFHNRLIRLDPGTTKNRHARTVPIYGDLSDELRGQRQLRDQKFPGCEFVFFNKNGERIKSFVKAWSTACKKIGLPKAIVHDFRRTGVRNLIRAGVPENVAMLISGHKTRSVFDRYDIVDENDVLAAGRAAERYLNESSRAATTNVVNF